MPTRGFAPVSAPSKRSTIPPTPALEAQEVQSKWLSYFEDLEDPRNPKGTLHPFLSVVIIGILATIGGATGWEDIEVYAEGQAQWLATFLEFPWGIPKADCYRRVFAQIKPESLASCFQRWVSEIVKDTGGQVIPIDGKTRRGSYDRGLQQSALHVVSAWSSEHRLMLGQMKVDDKSNEIKAIPALLELLDISGCIITIDAMGTQTDIASQIVTQKADYILCLKTNHPTLHQQVEGIFEQAMKSDFEGFEVSHDHRVEKGHHRREIRKVWVLPVSQLSGLYKQQQWAGLQSIVMVYRKRYLWNKQTEETQFFLTSLSCDAQQIGRAIRLHWGIENQLHWVLDVTFREDESRIRKGHGPENFTLLQRMGISALNQETSSKRSTRQKAKLASINPDYMMKVLASVAEE